MPAYNFKKQFADDVEKGIKRSTIRPIRTRRPTVVGDTLHLFYGLRTKHTRRLGKHTCISVTPIVIFENAVVLNINGQWAKLTMQSVENMAESDGFASVNDFINFFKCEYGLPTKNLELITW